MAKKRVVILGAAGRDFHDFNTCFRNSDEHEVVAFTATQIMGIEGRTYPPSLAGRLYPDGIPIVEEPRLEALIREHGVDEVVLSYSDLASGTVTGLAARAVAAGASFRLLGHRQTAIPSTRPVIAVTAVRTGCGKSQTTRYVMDVLRGWGLRVVAVRHPMPYGDLEAQRVQRFAEPADLDRHACTIEEREEYRPHIENGNVVYAGVDYEAILREAEAEADVILWDGGNNDTPFYRTDLWIVVTDPFRAGHELTHWPGRVNFIAADVILVNKVNTAKERDVEAIAANAAIHNPGATLVRASSTVTVDGGEALRGRKVLLVDDGPTLTHGDMPFGAAKVAAEQVGASGIADPRPHAVGTIRALYDRYPHLGSVLPAMGYGEEQVRELERTINATPCDAVLSATPADLGAVLRVNKPVVRAFYALEDMGEPTLRSVLEARRASLGGRA
jgi:predicted GTPase